MTLHSFEGRDVVQATMKVTNAGDGLSEALAIEPTEYHQGEKVHVVLECDVAKVTYEPIKDTEVLRRVHVLRAGTGVIADSSAIRKLVEEQRRANQKARESAAGVARLPGTEDT